VFWVGGWEIYMANTDTDFYAAYSEHVISGMEAEGAPAAEIDAARSEMAEMQENVKNPFIRLAFSSVEILPVGLLVALIASAVESRRRRTP